MRVEANGHGVVTDDHLNSEERADEFLLMGLRLTEGIDPRRYQALSGRSLDPGRIALLREEGAITVDADGRLRVTKDGFPVLDAVVADLAAYAPKLFGEPATGTPPLVVTFITASPRSLVPSLRKRNRPSMPAKPD